MKSFNDIRILGPNFLFVSGNGKNIGKTFLSCSIIKKFSISYDVTGIKISPHFHINSIEGIEPENRFFMEKEYRNDGFKDSSKMFVSGAANVYYIETTDIALKKNINQIIDMTDGNPVVCESGAITNIINPGISIYIEDSEKKEVKNEEVKNKADIILEFKDGKVYFDMLKLDFKKGRWLYKL